MASRLKPSDSYRNRGRFIGLVYLGVIALGMFSLAYVPNQLISMDDPSATTDAILNEETLFRWHVLAGFCFYVAFLGLAVALSRLMSPFGRGVARLMAFLAAASVPLAFAAFAQKRAILTLLDEGDIASPEFPAAVMSHLVNFQHDMETASIFSGLWLFPLGLLVFRSGIVPRVFGLILIAGSIGHLVSSFAPLIDPFYRNTLVGKYDTVPAAVGEMALCAWLLLMGAKPPPPSL